MAVYVSMLRGVNLAGHQIIKMTELCELYASLHLEKPRSFIQSGNVLFKSRQRNELRLAERIERAIEKAYGFRPAVIMRTTPQLRGVLARNPFAERPEVLPAKLLVTFLASEPGEEARQKVLSIKTEGEEIRIFGSELFVYYPDGSGRSKLSLNRIEKELKVSGTARNWNTVLKLLAIAEEMEAAT